MKPAQALLFLHPQIRDQMKPQISHTNKEIVGRDLQHQNILIKMPSRCAICCEILIAILLPPLGVCLRHGCCTAEFLICLLLTCLGYLPGIIYALYAIVFVDRDEYFDEYRRPLYAPA